MFSSEKIVLNDTKKSETPDEMNMFAFETKIRKIIHDIVTPSIVESNKVMVETKNEGKSLLTRVKLVEKRLGSSTHPIFISINLLN